MDESRRKRKDNGHCKQRLLETVLTIAGVSYDVSVLCLVSPKSGDATATQAAITPFTVATSPSEPSTLESRNRRVRPRAPAVVYPLYPPIDDLPDIPDATVIVRNATYLKSKQMKQATSVTTLIQSERCQDPCYPNQHQRQQAFTNYEYNTKVFHDSVALEKEKYEERFQKQKQWIQPNTPTTTPTPTATPTPPTSSTSPETAHVAKVEVSPGYWVELRGSHETWEALQRGFSIEVNCPCCLAHLMVIADADLALCPDCRMVIPIPQHRPNDSQGNSKVNRGLGLGVKMTPKQKTEIRNRLNLQGSFSKENSSSKASKSGVYRRWLEHSSSKGTVVSANEQYESSRSLNSQVKNPPPTSNVVWTLEQTDSYLCDD